MNKTFEEYLTDLNNSFKNIPQEIKSAIVNRDYKDMYGWEYTGHDGTPFNIAFENAVYSLGKIVKRNIIKKIADNILVPNEYWALQRSGMFYEFFPHLSGELGRDREEFTKFWMERERKKGWIELVLNPVYKD